MFDRPLTLPKPIPSLPTMVRLKDVAARAGVSVMTVSKVLRDAPDVGPTTKGRIRHLAKEMGYMPDSTAQGLRNRSSKLIGLVISSLTHPIYQELHRRNIPTVLMGHSAPFCGQFPNVEIEDNLGGYLATQHLIALGHTRIAFLAGSPAAPSSHERFHGYRRALRDAQLDVDDQLLFNAGSTIEEGQTAALQLLNENPEVTALQCVNDLVAIGAASVLLDQGLKIPQDISVVGFGNILLSEHFRVPLTTIRQPKFRIGTAATDTLLCLINGQKPDAIRFPVELLVRQSTAPPPTHCFSTRKPQTS